MCLSFSALNYLIVSDRSLGRSMCFFLIFSQKKRHPMPCILYLSDFPKLSYIKVAFFLGGYSATRCGHPQLTGHPQIASVRFPPGICWMPVMTVGTRPWSMRQPRRVFVEAMQRMGRSEFHGKKRWENHGKMVITMERSTIFQLGKSTN